MERPAEKVWVCLHPCHPKKGCLQGWPLLGLQTDTTPEQKKELINVPNMGQQNP